MMSNRVSVSACAGHIQLLLVGMQVMLTGLIVGTIFFSLVAPNDFLWTSWRCCTNKKMVRLVTECVVRKRAAIRRLVLSFDGHSVPV